MLCEQINEMLVDYADGSLEPALRKDVGEHLDQCATCQADYAAITAWTTMAANWHDEVPPAWRPPRVEGFNFWDEVRAWFPTAASATALVLVTVMFFQQPASNGTLPTAGSADFDTLPQLPQASEAAVVDKVLESSREQRQEELTALLKILTAEMNRRSVETEESLRYVISTQLQGQKELDDLYRRVEALLNEPAAQADNGMAPHSVPQSGVPQ